MEIPDTDYFRKVFLKYTKKAFELLGKINKPKILDVGCGTGLPTIELAYLSKGEVFGMDVDQSALEKFEIKIKNQGLKNRVKAINASFLSNNFTSESFDIIWAEGVFQIIGYDKSFKESHRLLKMGGHLVMADTLKSIKPKVNSLLKHGFELYNQVNWMENAWWIDYYQPLEKMLKNLRDAKIDPRLYEHLTKHEEEISMIKKNPKEFDCAHYLLRKIKN
ncbi:MAG: class I SAM-dependent methyltransferase [Candidatus Lokiarchaeota archaeon]|nr:class I SAM-dependent methyltransferase [Candidatus Lokiarchaeota archaeon]